MHDFNHVNIGIAGLLILWFCSACSILPRGSLPERELHIILYYDGSCLYSFEGLDYGKRTEQRWDLPYYKGYLEKYSNTYRCNTDGVYDNNHMQGHPDYAENWPGVSITVYQRKPNSRLATSPEGLYAFRPEAQKDIFSVRGKSVAEQIDADFYVTAYLKRGTRLNHAQIGLQRRETFFCGTSFAATDSPENRGIIYPSVKNGDNDVFMELNLKVVARQAGGC